MKTLLSCIFVCNFEIASYTPTLAVEKYQDSVRAQAVFPKALKVTIYDNKFRWSTFRYEAEVGISPIYPSGQEGLGPERLRVWIAVKPASASFWVDGHKSASVILRRDEDEAKGMIAWLIGDQVELIASAEDLSTTAQSKVIFPVLLLLVCCLGGAAGGWLRRSRNPASVVDLHFRLLPEHLSRKLEPYREILWSMVAGLLLFVLNSIFPLYLEFRQDLGADWLALAQPLFVGFTGGWGGINLFVEVLQRFTKKPTGQGPQEPQQPKRHK